MIAAPYTRLSYGSNSLSTAQQEYGQLHSQPTTPSVQQSIHLLPAYAATDGIVYLPLLIPTAQAVHRGGVIVIADMRKYVNLALMASFKEKWHKHPLLLAVIGAFLLTPIGAGISDWYKQRPILTTISSWLTLSYHNVILFMAYGVKVWVLVIMSLAAIFTWILIRYYRMKTLPVHYYYKEDTFNGWIWRWDWRQSDTDKKEWVIYGLTPFCPKDGCDTELIYSRDKGAVMECARCKSLFPYQEWTHPDYIKVLINDNVRKKHYGNI